MKALASYIMRGHLQAISAYLGLAVLSTLLPPITSPFSYLSAAIVGLVTLRNGAQAGVLLVAAGVIFLFVVAALTPKLVALVPGMIAVVVLSIMVWGVALVLKQTRALALSTITAGLMGIVVVVGVYLVIGDPSIWWEQALKELFTPVLEQTTSVDQQALNTAFSKLAPHMTGYLAAALTFNTLVCLLTARWWQSILYNPGGFQQEFHNLRVGKVVAIVAAGLALISVVPMGLVSSLADDFLKVTLTLFVLQGLSVIHAVVLIKKLKTVWLVAVYILLVLSSELIAMVGFVDTWVDFRGKLNKSMPAA